MMNQKTNFKRQTNNKRKIMNEERKRERLHVFNIIKRANQMDEI